MDGVSVAWATGGVENNDNFVGSDVVILGDSHQLDPRSFVHIALPGPRSVSPMPGSYLKLSLGFGESRRRRGRAFAECLAVKKDCSRTLSSKP